MDIVSTVSAAMREILGDELDLVARDSGVVVRQRQFTGRNLLLMVVATLLHKPDASGLGRWWTGRFCWARRTNCPAG